MTTKPSGALSLEQLHAAESRARARVEANLSPADLKLALAALRAYRTRIRNVERASAA